MAQNGCTFPHNPDIETSISEAQVEVLKAEYVVRLVNHGLIDEAVRLLKYHFNQGVKDKMDAIARACSTENFIKVLFKNTNAT